MQFRASDLILLEKDRGLVLLGVFPLEQKSGSRALEAPLPLVRGGALPLVAHLLVAQEPPGQAL